MKHIPLQSNLEPRSLRFANDRRLAWDAYSTSEDGHDLRQAKATEQHGVCGYCESKLADEKGKLEKGASHIDHFFPRHRGEDARPEFTFNWGNMVLSCINKKSCGFSKDQQNIPASDIIDPHVENPRALITFVRERDRYLIAQAITTLDPQELEHAENTIKALNLNDYALREYRYSALLVYKEEIDALVELFQETDRKGSNINELREEAQNLVSEIENKPFSSALLAYVTAEFKGFIEA